MKEEILKLRSEGKSYKQIQIKLGCSKSTISYHCGPGVKEKTCKRIKVNRDNLKEDFFFKLRKRYDNIFIINRNSVISQRIPKTFSFEDFKKFIEENPKCYLSGLDIDYTIFSDWELDHIHPFSKGGLTDLTNLKPCLKWANRMKGDFSVKELINNCQVLLDNLVV